MPEFLITRGLHQGHLFFKLTGNLDLRARHHLAATIESQWEGCANLLLDLAEVEEIDLSGLSWLMLAEAFMRRRGGRLQILAASRPVQRAMQLLNPATRTLFRRGRNHLPYRVHHLRRRAHTQTD